MPHNGSLLHQSWHVEKRGTDFAPWTIVHTATGLTVPVQRPYPTAAHGRLPDIMVSNHRSKPEAIAAAGEIDWAEVDRIAQDPAVQEQGRRWAERRAFDAAYQQALTDARAGKCPWPWEDGGLMHPAGEVVELGQGQLFDAREAA